MENKLLEVAKNAQKSFDRKSEFCFHVKLPSVFAFRCQEFTVNQQYEPCLFSLSVNHCKQSQGKLKNIDGKEEVACAAMQARKRSRSRPHANKHLLIKKWTKTGVKGELTQERGRRPVPVNVQLTDCWWPAREVLLSEICWLWNVGTFDLSVYWLANSNLNGFELDLIFFVNNNIYLK